MLPLVIALAPCAVQDDRPAPQPVPQPVHGKYLVVCAGEGDYLAAARELARWRGATAASWDGDWATLETLLQEHRPAWLALVLEPGAIDGNLPRRLVPMLARLDDDPFVDCAFGLITGDDGAGALRFVQTIERTAQRTPPARKFSATSVVLDRVVKLGPQRRVGHEGRALETTDLWLTGKDAGWSVLLAQQRAAASGAALVEWGHCGDSQGIWLFSMYRNRDHEKHWAWDPAKVGQDPTGEMPRLTPAALLEGVELGGAVVLNGSCHSAVTRRTIVGPDIVSTFGDTDGLTRFHDIRPTESFALSAIRHGAAAYIAPLAANHATRAGIEEWKIRAGGTALGEVARQGYDEMVLGATKLPLSFALYEDGKRGPHESPMWTDIVHRVLFGDPAFVLFRDRVATPHRVTNTWEEPGKRLVVDVTWSPLAEDPLVWDPWSQERRAKALDRVWERVQLNALPDSPAPAPRAIKSVRLRAAEADGQPSTELARATPQAMLDRDPAGHTILHVVARFERIEPGSPGDDKRAKSVRFVFEVEFEAPRD